MSNQGYSSTNTTEEKIDFGGVVGALTDCDLSTKCGILKAAGANEAEAATALLGKGHKAEEIASELGEAGYDTQKVNAFLDNIIKHEQVTAQSEQETLNIPALVLTSNQEQGNQETFLVQDVVQDISYQSLLDSGLTDAEIVAQLKAEGMSATDILKAATDLDRDMIDIANAMQEAGFSNADIVTAYIAKAMDWAVDATVNVVNCAVQALAAILSGENDIGGAILDLAYDVIVTDIMQSGEVNIQDGDIMSSMLAIKQVAAEHGVEFNGYNLSLSDLEGLNGLAIVHLDGNHWVTVTNIEGDTVTVMDNGKEVTMSLDEFNSRWDGNSLVVDGQQFDQNKLLDPQMRDIRGGRSGSENDSGGGMGDFGETHGDYGDDSDWGGLDNPGGGHSNGGTNTNQGGWSSFTESVKDGAILPSQLVRDGTVSVREQRQ